jgi:SNF family Na+-dependent transporter
MITVPAAFIFLGAAGVVGQGTFGLGFKVLPLVFSNMPAPWFFGFAWFFLLFLAAVTSSLSMLQPGIAFLEEGLGLNRKQSVSLLGLLTALGCLFVVYFSKDLKALDTLDFWVGTFLVFVVATILIILFGWVMGIEKGWQEVHKGAAVRIPNIYKFVIKYLCPFYLLSIFSLWILLNVFGWNPSSGEFKPTGYVTDLIGQHPNSVARLSLGLIAVLIVFFVITTAAAGRRWDHIAERFKSKSSEGGSP